MGNPKQKWKPEEEEALRAGIAKHGHGKWKLIKEDPQFYEFLSSRSNVDLKVFPFSFKFSTYLYENLFLSEFCFDVNCNICVCKFSRFLLFL